jgi:hypothetical protein
LTTEKPFSGGVMKVSPRSRRMARRPEDSGYTPSKTHTKPSVQLRSFSGAAAAGVVAAAVAMMKATASLAVLAMRSMTASAILACRTFTLRRGFLPSASIRPSCGTLPSDRSGRRPRRRPGALVDARARARARETGCARFARMWNASRARGRLRQSIRGRTRPSPFTGAHQSTRHL